MRRALLLLLLSTPAHAAPPDVAELTRVLGRDKATVTDGQTFALPSGERVTVGRYREGPAGKWLFPIAVAPAYCDDGKPGCVHIVHLGQAAKRITALAFVDLDAPRSAIPGLSPSWHTTRVTGPEKAKWPALVLAIERDQADPATTDLVIVSLRATKKERSSVLFDRPLEERYAEPSDAELAKNPRPPSAIVGRVLTSVVLERIGKEHRLTTTVQPIDSRTSMCLRTKPHVVVYVLEGTRYLEQPGEPAPRPCH